MLKYILIALIGLFSFNVYGQQLFPQKDIDTYKSYFPKFADKEVNDLIVSDRTIWYNRKVMPRAYGHNMESVPGGQINFHNAEYNISGDYLEQIKGHGKGGNANIEFPWNNPGGSGNNIGITNIKFINLPEGKPIVYFNNVLDKDNWPSIGRSIPQNGVSWIYPVGTVFGEALTVKGPQGLYIFELRLRYRQQEHWEIAIYRPYITINDLIKLIEKYEPQSDIVEKLTNNLQKITQKRFYDPEHKTQLAIDVKGFEYVLPDMSENLVHNILTQTEFVNCNGSEFYKDDNIQVFAPTTRQDFSIVPKNYEGNFAGADSNSCNNCHKHTEVACNRFDAPRQWYGRVSGSDKILSFHIIDLSSVANNGETLPIRFRKEFVNAGIVEKYDPQKHTREYYHMLKEE